MPSLPVLTLFLVLFSFSLEARELKRNLKNRKEESESLTDDISKALNYEQVYPPIPKDEIPIDCEQLYRYGELRSGEYLIEPRGVAEPFVVYCEMTETTGAWTHIMQRRNDQLSFNQTWLTYKEGFGRLGDSYWLGNERIHFLTDQGITVVRFEFTRQSVQHYAQYSIFRVGPEHEYYRISHLGAYSGTAGHTFANTNFNFSTYDTDYDSNPTMNCANSAGHGNGGGWWYNGEACSSPIFTSLYGCPAAGCTRWHTSTALQATDLTIKIRRI